MPRPSPSVQARRSDLGFPVQSQQLTPLQQQQMRKLYSYADLAEMHRTLVASGWTAQEEIETLVDIARNGEKVRERLSAIQMLHTRRMESLQLSGTIISATQTMTKGKKTTTVTAHIVNPTAQDPLPPESDYPSKEINNDTVQIVCTQPEHPDSSRIEEWPENSGLKPAFDAQPKCGDAVGMRGLAYHHTARRQPDGDCQPVEDGRPDLSEDGDRPDGQVGA